MNNCHYYYHYICHYLKKGPDKFIDIYEILTILIQLAQTKNTVVFGAEFMCLRISDFLKANSAQHHWSIQKISSSKGCPF